MPEIKTKIIVLQGREVRYQCTRKKVKNVNIRVPLDGIVRVSSPYFVKNTQIEEILTQSAGFILRALQICEQRAEKAPPALRFQKGETLSLFGVDYHLYPTDEIGAHTHIEGDLLILAVKDISDTEAARKALKVFTEQTLRERITSLCERIYPSFADATPPPEIKLRLMRARWGSCRPKTAIITFNTRLAFYPISCIEYVVMHEFTHFLHADHSPAFYAALAEKMPDWKERKAILNSAPMIAYI